MTMSRHVVSARRAVTMLVAAAAAVGSAAPAALAHGTIEGGRMQQVRQAGPAGGTPAAWNDSYYTWNQNSRNFPGYAAPGFRYADLVPDGKIASAGSNDGSNGSLNFSGLNTPSAGWAAKPAAAGVAFGQRFIATAPHEPSHFDVWMTRQGFDVTTQPLAWGQLEYLGRWSAADPARPVAIGTMTNPISGGPATSYDWSAFVPGDRSGRHALLTVWQRQDSAGESFWAVQDVAVAAVPEPSAVAAAAAAGVGLLIRRRRPRG